MAVTFQPPVSKHLHFSRAPLALVLLAACSGPSGCGGGQRVPPTTEPTTTAAASASPAVPAKSPQPGYVGEDTQVARASMQFRNAAAATSYDTLQACLARNEEGFVAYPLRTIGNFVNVEWCRGEGAQINCAGGDTREGAGVAWAELQVMHQDWPQVFGLAFDVADVPAAEGIGVIFHWNKGGKSILGDGVGLSFRQVSAGKVTAKVSVSQRDQFAVGLEPIEVKAEGDQDQLYARLRKSPDSLRAEIEGRLSALETAVHAALDADTPRKCIYGEYKGDGIEPPCIDKVPLSAAEKTAARKQLAERLSGERKLVADHYQQMHARFLEVLPDRCWSPASEQP